MVRQKKRYMIVELRDCRKANTFVKLIGEKPSDSVLRAVKLLHGDYGAAVVKPLQISFLSPKCGLMMVRCPRDSHKLLLSALASIDNVGGVPTKVKLLRVSATPRAAYQFLKDYNEDVLESYLKEQDRYKKWKKQSMADDSFDDDDD